MSELKASGVVWKRLRKVLLTTTLVVSAGGAAYGLTGGRLILGYGGMISFGHAAFLGIGAGSIPLPVCVMLGLAALCTVLSARFFRWE